MARHRVLCPKMPRVKTGRHPVRTAPVAPRAEDKSFLVIYSLSRSSSSNRQRPAHAAAFERCVPRRLCVPFSLFSFLEGLYTQVPALAK